ncbi:MAG: ABC transporter permease subunit [Anaerolineales bacterium]|jgi:ABC-2 type transport system permease protein
MNIFLHEFKSYLKSVGIWSAANFLIILVYFSAFNAIALGASDLQMMLDAFPEELLIAFGMNDMNFSTLLGWFGVVFLFCQICLAIQASNYGISLVSIEERELTADFLLPKPVGRAKILTAKFLAALAALTITNLVIWASSFFTINLMRDGRLYDANTLAMVLGTIVVFQLFFLSVGLLISLLMKRVRSVIPLSMALSFGMYILSAFGKMIGEDSLEIISPFRHFDPNYIINHQAYNWSLVAISLGAILVAIPASYLLYQKRNITAAV